MTSHHNDSHAIDPSAVLGLDPTGWSSIEDPLWVFDLDESRVVWANAAGLAFWHGTSLAELAGRDMTAKSDVARARLRDYADRFALGETVMASWTLMPAGVPTTVRCRCSGVPLADGRLAMLTHVLSLRDDSTDEVAAIDASEELRHARDRLAQAEARFRAFAEIGSDWLWETDAAHRFTYVSSSITRHTGYRPEDIVGLSRRAVMARIGMVDGGAGSERRAALEADLGGHRPFRDFRFAFRRASGELGHAAISGDPVFDSQGQFQGYRGIGADVTMTVLASVDLERRVRERTAALEAAREAAHLGEQRLQQAAAIAGLGYWIWDAITDRCLFCSEECAELHGLSANDYMARAATLEDDFTLVHEDDREAVQTAFHALRCGEAIELEYRITTPAGDTRHVRELARPILDETGRVVREHGTIFDITELRRSEAGLRQAQKMEALGQLTGGVAHDFNNLLAIIQGNVELLARRIGADSGATALIDPVLRAAQRGASITSRLLAFAGRQPLQGTSLHVGRVISELSDVLGASLGERIALRTRIDDDLWPCEADRGQLEQALLNLANNARDAMPSGGRLTISAHNEARGEHGDYVTVSFADTGTGMSEDVLARIFDPFFTTKAPDKGTGLGLSMVYGYLTQSGGHIEVESVPGEGTTFHLHLPRAEAGPQNEAAEADRAAGEAAGEVILVVEDEPDLRRLIVVSLTTLGYEVLEAGTGAAALEQIATHADGINLLLTDVALPGGIGGKAVAKALSQTAPDVPVIYMSGYAEGAIVQDGQIDPGVRLIAKPFLLGDLTREVRRVLDV